MLHRLRLAVLLAATAAAPAQAAERVVVLTADVAEAVVALGAQALLVGRDKLASQPQLKHVPVIGMSRALTPEPVLAVRPTLVLGSAQAQPPGIFSQLQKLGLRVEQIGHDDSPQSFADGLRRVGTLLGRAPQAETLAQQWQTAMAPRSGSGKRVLLSYDGRLVAGRGTAGDALIRAAGGINAAADVEGFLPLTPEAWLRAAPELVIVAAHNRPVYGGLAALKARPELAGSPAVRNGKVLEWPAARFLRLGMDSPQTVAQLRRLLP